jgi:peroxiredoxin
MSTQTTGKPRLRRELTIALVLLASVLAIQPAFAEKEEVVWSADEKPIADQIHSLRSLPDDVRAHLTKELALKIRQLPANQNKLRLADGLASLSTEGDFGHDTLQEVATTLAQTLKERPLPWPSQKDPGKSAARDPASPYIELASIVRYEHVDASLDNDQYQAAMTRLEADDHKREHVDFELKDLSGKTWSLADLHGKVVMVNFWATWCPPCRKEMPDLETLYERLGSQGLVILGISDEETAKVEPFIRERKVTFPILLDPGRKVNEAFIVEGIPKTFVYDRDGKLVAQSIDMRTQKQFQEMLAKAGISN